MGKYDSLTDDIVDSIDYIVKERLKNASFDKTRKGKITKILGNNKYNVLIDNVEYKVTSLGNEPLPLNTIVYILVPEGQYNNMFILSAKQKTETTTVTGVSSVNGKTGAVVIGISDIAELTKELSAKLTATSALDKNTVTFTKDTTGKNIASGENMSTILGKLSNFVNILLEAVEKLDGIDDNANKYVLPQASATVLGGIKTGNSTEIVDGKLEAKGLPAPDEQARQAISEHTSNETIHLTEEEKNIINSIGDIDFDTDSINFIDTRNTNETPAWYQTNYPEKIIAEFKTTTVIGLVGTTFSKLITYTHWHDSTGGYPTQVAFVNNNAYIRYGTSGTAWSPWRSLGHSPLLTANAATYTITKEMIGRTIRCQGDNGRKVILPAPADVGTGAYVYIWSDNSNNNKFMEVYTPSGYIYKGTTNLNKCVQPCLTVRKYISTGSNWETDCIPVSENISLTVYIGSAGSNTEPKYQSNCRYYANFENLDILLQEYKKIKFQIITEPEIALTKNMTFNDKILQFSGSWNGTGYDFEEINGTLVIPASYQINLTNCTLNLNQIHIKVSGTGFGIYEHCVINTTSYYNTIFMPYEDANVNLFVVSSGGFVTLTCQRTYFNTSNLSSYSNTFNVFYDSSGAAFGKGIIMIYNPASLGSRVYWRNGSTTTYRIGSSAAYML